MLSPRVKNLMERISLPAPVGNIILGFLISKLGYQWNFIDHTFENVISELGVAALLGFSHARGTLFAGLAFSSDPNAIRNETRFTLYREFFAPFFFIHIRMQVDPAAFTVGADIGLLLAGAGEESNGSEVNLLPIRLSG